MLKHYLTGLIETEPRLRGVGNCFQERIDEANKMGGSTGKHERAARV